MIISMKEMLQDAEKRNYAIGCYNAIDLTMARGVIEAAESEKSPVIICHAEVHYKYTPLEMIAPVLISLAKNAKIPVAILLDHGQDFGSIIRAMHLGFNAVMFDGSKLDYDDNILQTKEIVKIAHELGVTVEAELGQVSRPVSGGAEGHDEDDIIFDTSHYTNPEQAAEFIDRTGADCLAAAFGTVHGMYLAEPKLDFERLQMIKKKTGVPIVMHGGSGLSVSDFQQSTQNGVSKINYYTNMAYRCANEVKEKILAYKDKIFYQNLMMWSLESIQQDIQATMKVFGSSGKA